MLQLPLSTWAVDLNPKDLSWPIEAVIGEKEPVRGLPVVRVEATLERRDKGKLTLELRASDNSCIKVQLKVL